MTSRSEYRLILRQDNADLRLTDMGHEIGLISDERYARFVRKRQDVENELARLKGVTATPKNDKLQQLLECRGTPRLVSGAKLCDPACTPADKLCRPCLCRPRPSVFAAACYGTGGDFNKIQGIY